MRKLIKNFVLLIAGLMFVQLAFCQSHLGSVRGFVYNDKTGEPVIYTSVFLAGTQYGITTDENGYYSITKVAPGKYKLTVKSLGFEDLVVDIEIKPGKIVEKTLNLTESVINIDAAVVSGERQEMKTSIRTSVVKITPKQIEKIPTMGSQPDLAQYLQVIPGVVFTGDQGGQLYIRGGAPVQNKVLLDGMIIYNPFHSIGLFSVFDSDILNVVDVYTGGFSAEYGGRISSIMDIRTRDGNKKQISGSINASPFGSKLLIEGPLHKMSDDSEGSTSFILSGKTSYLEESSKLLYSYIDTAGLPFNFTDIYGKLSLNAKNGSKLNLFGFNFNDQVNYQDVSDLNWSSMGMGANAVILPTGFPAMIKANISYSSYGIIMEEENQAPRESNINGFNLGLDFIYYYGKDQLTYGIEILGFNTEFNYHNSVGRKITQEQYTTELGGYMKYKKNFGKLLIEPSFRLHYYASLSEISPEPRLGMKYNVSDNLRFKFAGGLYSQNLIAANSDRDVVNLFYGFLSGPDNLQSEFDGEKVDTKLQKSVHAILGVEYDVTNRVHLNLEGYIKDNTQLTNINRNKLYDDSEENIDKPDYLKKDFILETGKAYGFDVTLKYDYKRLYLWMVYSLGWVTRFDGIIHYAPHFDRRHNVNLVGSYTFGKDLNWEFSTRWNLGSGFPFTQTQGFYEKLPFYDGINTDYTKANGELGIIYAGLNEGRLPYYHRLDMNLKRKFFIGDNAELEITFSITNVYNRNNIFYFDRVRYERVDQLPFMPSLGASLKF